MFLFFVHTNGACTVILPWLPFFTLAMGTADIQSVCNILSQEEETENKFKTNIENKLKAHGVS